MNRKIVSIDKEKCNGCGLCVNACHEGAIELVEGKAQLISDEYCDGLGDCLPECPTGAITIIEREALPYDDDAVQYKKKEKQAKNQLNTISFGCPGTKMREIKRSNAIEDNSEKKLHEKEVDSVNIMSQLNQWPVQLKLINSSAPYFKGADLLIAADCTAYAYGNFHNEFIKGHVTVIGCPKLDDNEYYVEKLKDILIHNEIRSITVVRMEVPCCSGIVKAIKQAMLQSSTIVPYKEVTIGIDGNIIETI